MKKNGLMCLWVDVPCYHSTIPFFMFYFLLYFTISFVDSPHQGTRDEGWREGGN